MPRGEKVADCSRFYLFSPLNLCFFASLFIKIKIPVQQVLEDPDLGRLYIRSHTRASRLTFRTKRDAVYVTVPPCTSMREVKQAVEQLRPRLLQARKKLPRQMIDWDYTIDADCFKLNLVPGDRRQFLAHSSHGTMQIVCPTQTDFADANLQAWLRKVIEEALRKNAKAILPPRLEELAKCHRLFYKTVKINASTGRWGSCSTTGNINLSCFLLLLPPHLIDYVLLHELAHTRELNHGERFWALLDEWTDGKARALREELKKYQATLPFQ